MHGVEQHSGVLDRLGRSIASGDRVPGTVLTLAGLEEEFGVSRTLVREVVRVLESMGMLESRRRVGVTVRPPRDWNPFDPRLIRWRLGGPGRDAQLLSLTELRAAIEPMAARLAAARADESTRRRLVELAARLKELGQAHRGTDPEYLATDIAYHELLLAASGNPMLAALGGVVAEVLSGRTALGLMPRDPAPGALEDHEATAAAVASGDAATAEARARAVVTEVLEEVADGTG
ncbi:MULTISPECIES: FadR/GntR family transcriptional regulator [unclassified Kocuria]|uniref:FadR/GntR family transcriptional regulator n=1 Tax=unclassified Kocuria TaxID=2649579 RepID=UPI000649F345|nr:MULTISPECIES: FCD domain-containing protein [unclassified Kocuria]KLU09444.1 transcriptional regulator [Kocuria sp. SM24M-10]OLT08947.1 transcriptional regulator [Kocuria sp. CNJ-770]